MINRVPKTFWLFVALLAGLAIVTAFVNGQEAAIAPIAQDDCDTCGCAGLIDEGPMELSSGRLIKWWLGPGTMKGLTRQQFEARVVEGVKEFDEVCGLDFVRVEKENQAKIRFYIKNDMDVLGRAFTSGKIHLMGNRTIGSISTRRVVQPLSTHEIGHVFSLNHVSARNCTMHAHLGTHWCPGSVKRLQDLWKTPEANDEPWHPTDRVAAGVAMRESVEGFKRADQAFRTVRNRRNALVGVGDVDALKAANDVVRTKLEARTAAGNLVAQRHREWWAINKAWNTSGVKGFVRLGQ